MTKMLTLIFSTTFLLATAQSDGSWINRDCYQLLEDSQVNSGCTGTWWQRGYIETVNCFEENGNFDEAINVVFKILHDVDGQLEFAGDLWIEKYVHLIEKKHTHREIGKKLKNAEVIIDLDNDLLELIFGEVNVEKIKLTSDSWENYIFPL